MNLNTSAVILGGAFAVALTATVSADVPAIADGNRYYDLPRSYQSEISVSEAYLAMEHSKDYQQAKGPKPVLIDVRTLREYASGHPEDAYSVPFPHIWSSNDQDPVHFYWEVYRIVGGRMDTPIMTLCRTGHRSVLAGNILADPESDPRTAGLGLEPFTHVQNIWEGFVGQPKYAFRTGSSQLQLDVETDPDSGDITVISYQLDLNNDGVINSDTADVYDETKDANPDKDGWRNFAGLPWSTHIQKPLAYERDPGLYDALNLTPVQ